MRRNRIGIMDANSSIHQAKAPAIVGLIAANAVFNTSAPSRRAIDSTANPSNLGSGQMAAAETSFTCREVQLGMFIINERFTQDALRQFRRGRASSQSTA
jgi:hypothetical protein